MKRTFYSNEQINNKEAINSLNKKTNIMSFIRLLLFVLIIGGFSLFYSEHNIIYFIIGLICLIAFVLSVLWQNRVDWELEVKKSIDELCSNYLKRFDHTWQMLEQKGEQFKDNNDFIASDLDIIGDNSLYQYICLAKSNIAQQKLFNVLKQPDESVSDIMSRQEAVSELANKPELHLKLASLINNFKPEKSDLQLNDHKFLNNKELSVYRLIAYIYPIIAIVILFASIFNLISYEYLSGVIFVSIIILLIRKQKNKEYIANVFTHNNNINIFIKVLDELEKHTYKSKLLNEKKSALVDDYQASKSLQKLIKFQDRLKSQSNVIVYVLANIFLMWDYRNVVYYDQWKKTWGKNAHEYLEIFYDVEVLLSLGVIEQTHKISTLPKIIQSNNVSLVIKDGFHPLLNKENVITNDFATSDDSIIITGSNMSGKTTFIRSVGINMILAYAGASVCAKEFEATHMKIFTSIRVEDDFNKGVSTFYAEINRIKSMIDYSKLKLPMITFVDEIFKGTNSEDRIYGATKAIEALSNKYAINFTTTHDAQLTKIDNTINYHFAEYYQNNEIMFDYKIKTGPCQTRNAKYLLKMAGIIVD